MSVEEKSIIDDVQANAEKIEINRLHIEDIEARVFYLESALDSALKSSHQATKWKHSCGTIQYDFVPTPFKFDSVDGPVSCFKYDQDTGAMRVSEPGYYKFDWYVGDQSEYQNQSSRKMTMSIFRNTSEHPLEKGANDKLYEVVTENGISVGKKGWFNSGTFTTYIEGAGVAFFVVLTSPFEVRYTNGFISMQKV